MIVYILMHTLSFQDNFGWLKSVQSVPFLSVNPDKNIQFSKKAHCRKLSAAEIITLDFFSEAL